uniref:SHC adaptor protein 2 n=1 Tax=Anas platyrhynchos platyrhynchos TaxID=8840 RepID=A0A493TSA1_ANAPP
MGCIEVLRSMRSLDFNTRTQVTRWGPAAAPTQALWRRGDGAEAGGGPARLTLGQGQRCGKGLCRRSMGGKRRREVAPAGRTNRGPMTPGEAGGCCRRLGLVAPRAVGRGGSWEGAGVCSDNAVGLGACREAINRLYEAVPGVKGIWKKKVSLLPGPSFSAPPGPGLLALMAAQSLGSLGHPLCLLHPRKPGPGGLHRPHPPLPRQAPNKALFSILGKSNLRFAGMSIAVNISVDGLNLMIPTTRQVRAGHRTRPPAPSQPPASSLSSRCQAGAGSPPSNPTVAVPTDHRQPPHAVHLLRLRRGHGEALATAPPWLPAWGAGPWGCPEPQRGDNTVPGAEPPRKPWPPSPCDGGVRALSTLCAPRTPRTTLPTSPRTPSTREVTLAPGHGGGMSWAGGGVPQWGARGSLGLSEGLLGTRGKPRSVRPSVRLPAACHILECCDGLAQSVINTVGQAFELRFKQYLHSPPKVVVPPDRVLGMEESAWGEDDEMGEHDYYNSIPGKEPPPGGLVDSRLRHGTLLGHVRVQPPSSSPASQGGLAPRREQSSQLGPPWDLESQGQPCDGYLQADGHPLGPRDYEEHMYVNTQSLDTREPDAACGAPEESPKKDLFDMRPFEDALKLHECMAGGGGSPPVEDQWPSPPTRKAPIAPTEEQLRREPWYHGKMSRRDAEKLLQMDGDFLVRDSITNPGQYVLTGMHCGQPKHLLLVDPEGVVRTKDVLFESISHLISHHRQNEQPIVAAESELHLRQVVRRKQ